MNIQDFISKYSKSKISEFDYDEIVSDIHDIVLGIPVPIVSLHEEELIERIRNNYDGEIFYEQNSVSIRRDLRNITEFGRANKPHHSNFYGTLADDNIDLARITTVIETHKTLRTGNTDTTEQQIFTTSQWLVKGNLRLVIIPFHEQAKRNKRLGKAADHFNSAISADFSEFSSEILELLAFFSNHFGREVIDSLDYKLTAAFGEVFMQDYNLDGIIYPSIRSEFETQNVVLNETALSSIGLHKVGMFELFIHRDQVFIDPIAYAENLGLNSSKFDWVKVKRTPIEVINQKLRK